MHSKTMDTNLRRGLACATAALGVACLGYAAYALAPATSQAIPQAQAKTKTFKPGKDAHKNWKKLNGMLTGNKTKVVAIKPGSNFKVDAPLRPGDNTTIDATDSTITITKRGKKTKQDLVFPTPKKTGYNSFKNLTIRGGKWRSYQKDGYTGGLIALAHGRNIVLDGIDVNANWNGHAIELIACKDVTIKNSKVWSIGKISPKRDEEALQIDLATKKSAPQIAAFGKKYVKGQTCQNVTIDNCYIDGARGVCASYNNSEKGKWLTKYHKNITVTNSVIVGETSEAVALFNTVGAKIDNNTLITRSTGETGGDRSMAFMAALFGKAPANMKKSTMSITNNQVYGKRNGIEVRGLFTKKKPRKALQRYGTVIATGNHVETKEYDPTTKIDRAIFFVVEGRNTANEVHSVTEDVRHDNEESKWDGSEVSVTWNGQELLL